MKQLITLLKAQGEGSRGGKVIGHTRSGKPVYQGSGASGKSYSDFTAKDHEDAYVTHLQHLKKRPNTGDLTVVGDDAPSYAKQSKHAESHRAKANGMNQRSAAAARDANASKLGSTKSNKTIFLDRAASHSAYAKFTPDEHMEAAAAHEAHGSSLSHDRYNLNRQFNQAKGHIAQAIAKKRKAGPGSDAATKSLQKANKPLGAAFSHARKVAAKTGGGRKKEREVANRYLKKKGHDSMGKAMPTANFGQYAQALAMQAQASQANQQYDWQRYMDLFALNHANTDRLRVEAQMRQLKAKP